jgi:hypothetical protein
MACDHGISYSSCQTLQGGVCSESLVRVLLTVAPLQGDVATFLLETLVALSADDGANSSAMDVDAAEQPATLSQLILTQLEALNVSSCSAEVIASMLEAFGAATPQLQVPLANILGEMVPAKQASGAPFR